VVYAASASAVYMFRMWRVDSSGKREPKRYDLAGFGATQPVIAPAGDRLAFYRFVSDTHIRRYRAGEDPKPFLASSSTEANAEFSPDGSRVVFSSGRSGDRVEIWLADADGTRLVQLTSGLGSYQSLPKWSPDGRRIAFVSHEAGGQSKIYVIDADGGRPRQVVADAYNNALSAWSRDGKWIYFRSSRTGTAEIWRVPSAGGDAQQVTENGGLYAVESTDGKTLFYSDQEGVIARRLADRSEQRLFDSVTDKLFTPVEDGIYYIGARGSDARHRPLQFYDFANGTSHLVTNLEGLFGQGGLSLSPDRKTILFTASVQPVSDVMMIENFR
jgi:Tol biopolymer transport system component